ncbi:MULTISPECIES: iron uptake porin [Cyanophyceae]|uniref:iron uptake porin n=1 Tax=Cyanophyceae TaxID=3028117 RepID=UPI00232E787D|nr:MULTISPECIES: iron uptake porin [Cyanophyceae]MDB9355769.1 iron uptake porin [Nodularia spumigena CS-587/03]MDB9304261.1 iron uptake porin [Nodularia spumigena CS-591/12]MDB9340982.1 iron uptake porin [Nodularia spumigena CS-589/07]MDB9341992.1 iron uptake porin [Nodularia spumigena CS-588/06]MDB9347480.1 iron uptake porin [Nodularia spumigena CS-588/01]
MLKVLSGLVLAAPIVAISPLVWAGEIKENDAAQVTSVSQLSDVQPTDWAFIAVQSLVERYGCVAGYPNGTFLGNRAMTRYEFAAGLNACLDRVNELIATATLDVVQQEDLATLQRLQEEFSAELATLRGRVDSLESRTAVLESQQFSTTTKLSGEVILALTDVLTGDSDPFGVGVPRNSTILANRVRLNLVSSFTGQDELKIRLQAGSTPHPQRAGGFRYGADPVLAQLRSRQTTPEGGQTFNQEFPDDAGNVEIGTVSYKFPVGNKLRAVVFANRGEHVDYLPNVLSTVGDDDGGSGSLSTFAQYSPIYRIGSVGAGLGLNYELSPAINLSLGYLATNASSPENLSPDSGNGTTAGGLFNGRYSALAQLTIEPTPNLAFGFTYVNAYATGTPTFLNDVGTISANSPSLISDNARRTINAYGVAGLWRVSPKFAVNSWFMYTNQEGRSAGVNNESADVYSYAIALAFPDLGKQGNLGGIIVGVPPHATRSGIANPAFRQFFGGATDLISTIPNRATPLHLEAFYKYKLNDHISITPGVIWLVAPNQTCNNPDVVIGTIRTSFTF